MAWTAPITFVSSSVLTAAQMNMYLRDNMLETMPAKAASVGNYFIGGGQNVVLQQSIASDSIDGNDETTDSTDWGDLATVGPSVTVNVQARALVFMSCNAKGTNVAANWMGYEVSGATESESQDNRAIMNQCKIVEKISGVILHDKLAPGETTFTAKYRVSETNTASFSHRKLAVMPL